MLERLEKLATILSLPLSLFATFFAYWQTSDASHDIREATQTRALEWTPVLSILVRRSTAEAGGPLGVFLQNVGKGPARINSICQEHLFSELKPMDGIRKTESSIAPEDVLRDGEDIPLVEFRPTAEGGWTEQQQRNVQMALRQLETAGSSITICYESFYKGCFVAKRGPDRGDGWRQLRSDHCDDPCCKHPSPRSGTTL